MLKFQASAMNSCLEKCDKKFCHWQTDTHTRNNTPHLIRSRGINTTRCILRNFKEKINNLSLLTMFILVHQVKWNHYLGFTDDSSGEQHSINIYMFLWQQNAKWRYEENKTMIELIFFFQKNKNIDLNYMFLITNWTQSSKYTSIWYHTYIKQ